MKFVYVTPSDDLTITPLQDDTVSEFVQGSLYSVPLFLNSLPKLRDKFSAFYLKNTDAITSNIHQGLHDALYGELLEHAPLNQRETLSHMTQLVSHILQPAITMSKDQQVLRTMFITAFQSLSKVYQEETSVPELYQGDTENVHNPIDLTDIIEWGKTDLPTAFVSPWTSEIVRVHYFLYMCFLDRYIKPFRFVRYHFSSHDELHQSQARAQQYRLLRSGWSEMQHPTTKANDRPFHIMNNTPLNSLDDLIDRDDFPLSTETRVRESILLHAHNLHPVVFENQIIPGRVLDAAMLYLNVYAEYEPPASLNISKDDYRGSLFIRYIYALMIQESTASHQCPTATQTESVIERDHADIERILQLERQLEVRTQQWEDANEALVGYEQLKVKYHDLETQMPVESTCEKQDTHRTSEVFEKPFDSKPVKTLLNKKTTMFVGGDANWRNKLKRELHDAIFIVAEERNSPLDKLFKSEIIVLNTSLMNHTIYYRIKSKLEQCENPPQLVYINTQASNITRTYRTIHKQLQEKGLLT